MEGQDPPWAARGVMGLLGQARVRSTWRCGRGRRGGARGAHQTRRRWPGRLQPGSYSQPFCGGRQPCLGWASAGESEHVWVRGGRHKAEIKASAVFLCPPPRNTDKTRSSHRQPRSQVFRIWKQISRHARSRVAPSRSPFYLTIFDPAQVSRAAQQNTQRETLRAGSSSRASAACFRRAVAVRLVFRFRSTLARLSFAPLTLV